MIESKNNNISNFKIKVWLPSYNESCQESIVCDKNLFCKSNKCLCNSTSYWSSIPGYCGMILILIFLKLLPLLILIYIFLVPLPSFNESCQESIVCDYNKYLICNNDNSTCVCNSTSYWAAELGLCGKFFIFWKH